jgi:sigma-B regulation protein RsbQ
MLNAMTTLKRNNVHVTGYGERAMMFAHGFGCDQNMWRYVAPAFEDEFRTVLFDHVGAGGSDLSAYDAVKYAKLDGYADDVVEIGRELGLSKAVFVGHSVSAMIGMLASLKAPEMFESLVFVGPSPRYINDDGYTGGFTATQIAELLDFLADNHLGWSSAMAPAIMANPERPELGEELTNSFCRHATVWDQGSVNRRVLCFRSGEAASAARLPIAPTLTRSLPSFAIA